MIMRHQVIRMIEITYFEQSSFIAGVNEKNWDHLITCVEHSCFASMNELSGELSDDQMDYRDDQNHLC